MAFTKKVGKLVVDMAADVAALRGDMASGAKAVEDGSRRIESAAGIAKAGLVGMAAALGPITFHQMIRGAADAMDAVDELSKKLSISSRALQEYAYAGKLSGVQTDDMAGSLKKLQVTMLESISGGKEQAAVFKALGIAVKDNNGLMRTAGAVLEDVADVFARMPDDATKTALAIKLFGKNGAELVGFLNQGSVGIKDLREEAHALGAVLEDEALKAAADFNDQLDRLQTSAHGARNAIVADLLPPINDLIERFIQGRKAGMGFWEAAMSAGSTTVGRAMGQSYGDMIREIDRDIENLRTSTNPFALFGGDNSKELAALERKKKAMQAMQALRALEGAANGAYEDQNDRRLRPAPLNLSMPDVGAQDEAYRAGIAKLEGAYRIAENNLKTHLDILQSQYNRGLVGDRQYLEQRYQLEREALQKQDELRKQEIAAASKQGKTDDVAKYVAERNDIANKLRVLEEQIAERRATLETQLQQQIIQIEADGLKKRGQLSDAYVAEFQAKYAATMKRALLDGNQELVDALTELYQSGLSEAQFNETKARFEEAFTQLGIEIERVHSIAEADGGIVAKFNAAGMADEIRDKALPQLQKFADQLKEIAEESGNLGLKRQAAELGRTLEREARKTESVWKDTVRSIEGDFRDTWRAALSSNGDAWDDHLRSLRDKFKLNVIDAIYDMLARPFVMRLVATTSGSFGFNGIAQAASGSGGMSGMGGMPSLDWLTDFGGSVTSTTANMANWFMNSDIQVFKDIGNVLGSNAASIGEAANGIGAAMSYINALKAAKDGNWGQAAGTAIGQYFGGPIGAFVGNKIGSWVDKKFGGEERGGAQYGYKFDNQTLYNNRRGSAVAGAAPGVNFLEGPSGGEIAKDEVKGAIAGAVDTINAYLKGLGSSATLTGFQAGLETSDKGRGGVFSGGTLSTGVTFGESGRGDNYAGTLFEKASTQSPDAKTAVINFMADLKQATVQALQAATDIPKSIAEQLRSVDAEKLTEEEASSLLAGIGAQIAAVNQFRDAISALPLASLRDLSFDAAAALLKFSGGVQNLTAGMQAYIQNFYSEQERMDALSRSVQDQLKAVGYTNITTKEQFRAAVDELVRSGAVLTEEGAKAYATMMGVASAFAQVADYAKKAADEAIDSARRQAEETARAQQEAQQQAQRVAQEVLEAAQEQARRSREEALRDVEEAYIRERDLLRDRAQRLDEFARSLRSFNDSLRTGALSPLSPILKYQELKGRFDKTYAMALAGDPNAQGQLQAVAQEFLEASQVINASSEAYVRDYDAVTAAIESAAQAAAAQADMARSELALLERSVAGILDLNQNFMSLRQAIESYLAVDRATAGLTGVGNTAGNSSLQQVRQYGAQYGMDAYYLIQGVNDFGAKLEVAQRTAQASGSGALNFGAHSMDYWANVQALFDAGRNPTASQSINESISAASKAAVESLYGELFNRHSDAGGLSYWSAKLDMGTATIDDIRASMLQSAEYMRLHGSHASGLDYVPFDGYRAELHRGEAVLRASEASEYRSGRNSKDVAAALERQSAAMDRQTAAIDRLVGAVATGQGGLSEDIRDMLQHLSFVMGKRKAVMA